MTDLALAGAYSATGASWQTGPGRIYDRLADELAARCPIPLSGATVIDVGAGTGAATRAAQRLGAATVAVDLAIGMLEAGSDASTPAVVGDALALPFTSGAFDVALAAFSLNHLTDPTAGLRETTRVVRRGGAVLAAAYAVDDTHPVKAAVDAAAEPRGWTVPEWMGGIQRDAAPRLATVARAMAAANQAGCREAVAEHVLVPFPELDAADLVAWRLGMPHLASFMEQLPSGERAALAVDAMDRLGDPPMLVRSVIVLIARV